MSHLQFLKPFHAAGLVAVVVRLADAEQIHAQPGGQYLGELRLAGAGGTVQQDVDSGGAALQRTPHDFPDVLAVRTKVIEVAPLQLARHGIAQQQAGHVLVGPLGRSPQPHQPFHQPQVIVAVERDQTGAQQRRTGADTFADGVHRHAEEPAQQRIAQAEDVGGHEPVDPVHQRLDDRLGLVADQYFHDGQVETREVGHLAEAPQIPSRGILARPPGLLAEVPQRLDEVRARPVGSRQQRTALQQIGMLQDPLGQTLPVGGLIQTAVSHPCHQVVQVGEDEMPLVRGDDGCHDQRSVPSCCVKT